MASPQPSAQSPIDMPPAVITPEWLIKNLPYVRDALARTAALSRLEVVVITSAGTFRAPVQFNGINSIAAVKIS